MGTYRPDPVRTFEARRPDGRTRTMWRLSPRDAATWDALAGRLAGPVEQRLDRHVVAARAEVAARGWWLAPWGPALRTARALAERLAREGPVVATDVASFYGSVRPGVVRRALLEAGTDPDDARLAAAMLEGWEGEGLRGLPVGPRGSAVLASAVLIPVDRALVGTPFIRWVDDYLLGDPGMLPRLDEALDRVGLVRSERKTRTGAVLPWPGSGCSMRSG